VNNKTYKQNISKAWSILNCKRLGDLAVQQFKNHFQLSTFNYQLLNTL